jgi:hypothetical protein
VLLLLSLFVLYNAARLAIFARADYDRQRLPFVAAVAILAAVVGGLACLALVIERKQRLFTGKENSNDDIKPQD